MSRSISWLVVVAICIGLLPVSLAAAQGGTWSETFDDPALPGWEHSPGVSVVEGVLRIEPGQFAGHGGDWADFTLAVSLRLTGPGGMALIYHIAEGGSHILLLGDSGAEFQRESEGQVIPLGAAPHPVSQGEWHQLQLTVTGDTHSISLDGAQVFSASDPGSPVQAGGITFEALGDVVTEVDNLTLTMGAAALQQPEPPAQPTPPPAQIPTGETGVWVRTGGPPGGLGYDIRYNFADPTIWYVTDAFSGVHISFDSGYSWQPSNTGIKAESGSTGDGIPVFCLTVDPHNPQIVWAGTQVTGHIYRSIDGGQTWEQRDNGVTIDYGGGLTFRGITVDPHSSDIVYAMGETSDPIMGYAVWGAGTGGAIFRTTDAGEHWEVIWDGGIPSSLARYMWIDPRDSNILYVSTGIFDRGAVGEGDPNTDADPFGGLGILKSMDGGETWRVLDDANGLGMLYIGSLYMHPDHPDVLLAAAGHVTPGPAAERLSQAAHRPNGIYRTEDGGETWTQVVEPPQERAGETFSAVELCPSDPNIGYAGSDLAIYHTADAGQTWTLVSGGADGWGPPGVMAGWPIDMQCDPRDPNRVFANNYNGGNFLSEDGGRTWRNASQGYTGAQIRRAEVVPSQPNRVYVAGRSGGWRTDDGGASWQGLYHPPAPGLEWQSIAPDPLQPDHVLANAGIEGEIYESDDGGQSWDHRWSLHVLEDQTPSEIGNQIISQFVFAPSQPATVYAGLISDHCSIWHELPACQTPGTGVIVSYDGGTTWQRAVDEYTRDLPVLDLAVDYTDPQVVYAATTLGVFRTGDGGNTWMPLTILPETMIARAIAIAPGNPQHILVGLESAGVYVSYDGGATWQASFGMEPNGSLHDILFDPVNPQTVYASDITSGIYRSTDGGQTWQRLNNGLLNRAAMGLSITSDGQHIFLSIDGDGVYRLDLNSQSPQ